MLGRIFRIRLAYDLLLHLLHRLVLNHFLGLLLQLFRVLADEAFLLFGVQFRGFGRFDSIEFTQLLAQNLLLLVGLSKDGAHRFLVGCSRHSFLFRRLRLFLSWATLLRSLVKRCFNFGFRFVHDCLPSLLLGFLLCFFLRQLCLFFLFLLHLLFLLLLLNLHLEIWVVKGLFDQLLLVFGHCRDRSETFEIISIFFLVGLYSWHWLGLLYLALDSPLWEHNRCTRNGSGSHSHCLGLSLHLRLFLFSVLLVLLFQYLLSLLLGLEQILLMLLLQLSLHPILFAHFVNGFVEDALA